MYVPKGDSYYQKDIDKMNHDLACGINPKDILLYTTSPSEDLINDPDPTLAIKPKRAALNVVCDLYYNLLAPDSEFAPAVDKYRQKVKDRINSAAVAGWQAMTYADTHQKRFIDLKELGGDFYKIAGMQEGQEYNYTLDYRKTGVSLEPDAISRVIGYYNKQADAIPAIQQEKQYQDALNLVFAYVTSQGKFRHVMQLETQEYLITRPTMTLNETLQLAAFIAMFILPLNRQLPELISTPTLRKVNR
jgi:hypothetical protein